MAAHSKTQAKRVNKDIARLESANAALQNEININNQMIDLYRKTLALIGVATNGVQESVPA